MNTKRVLIDSNVIIKLYESEYRCKDWQISSYFKSILKLIEEDKIIIIPEVKKEVMVKKPEDPKKISPKTIKPKLIEAKERYKGYLPGSIMDILENSGKQFINDFSKNNIDIFNSLIKPTVEQKNEYEEMRKEKKLKLKEIEKKELLINEGCISFSDQELKELQINKKCLKKGTEFKKVSIDKDLETWLMNYLNNIKSSQNKLKLGEFLARLSSTIDLSAKQIKTVDMKIGIYSVLNDLCISTYDGRILKAFNDSDQGHLIVYQHYLFTHFGLPTPK